MGIVCDLARMLQQLQHARTIAGGRVLLDQEV